MELFKGFTLRSMTNVAYTDNTLHPLLGAPGGGSYGYGTSNANVGGVYGFLNTSPFYNLMDTIAGAVPAGDYFISDINDIKERLGRPTRQSSPSTAASRSPTSRPAGRAPPGGHRLQDLQEHPGPPAARGRRPRRPRRESRGPVAIAFVRHDGDAVTAAKALRDFARTNPNLVLKGGLLGPRLLSSRDIETSPTSRPRAAARPPGRRVPGSAGQGGRPVPGVHPELRLWRQGLIDQRVAAGEALPRQSRSSRRPSPSGSKPRPPTETAGSGRGSPGSGRPRPTSRAAEATEPAQASEKEE